MNKEKLQQVIDALQSCGVSSYDGRNGDEIEDQCYDEDLVKEALAIMQAELDKPLPEPVAWITGAALNHWLEKGILDGAHQYTFLAKSGNEHSSDNPRRIAIYAEPPASKLLTESSQDRTKKYFSYYPEGGFELHNSAEEAKKSAEYAIDTEREYACEGWSEYVDKICWGEVRQHVVETMNRPRTDADHVDSEFDTIVDYGLVDAANKELEKPVNKHEESYSDALRSLASYVGCGGYNADDPIDAKEFEEKIRFGIDLMLSTAQSQPCVRKPLSDDEIESTYGEIKWRGRAAFFAGVRFAEDKHGIKEQE